MQSIIRGQQDTDMYDVIGSNKLEISKYSQSKLSTINDKEKLKEKLIHLLVSRNLFWSYNKESILQNASDSLIIETVMKYGELSELVALAYIYPIHKLKEVWNTCFGEETIYKKEAKLVSTFLFNSTYPI